MINQTAGDNAIQIASGVVHNSDIRINNDQLVGTSDVIIDGYVNGRYINTNRSLSVINKLLSQAEIAMAKHNHSLAYVPYMLKMWFCQDHGVTSYEDETLQNKKMTVLTDDEFDQVMLTIDRVNGYVNTNRADFWVWLDAIRLSPARLQDLSF